MCKKQYSVIAKGCNVTEKNVRDAIINVAQLEPKPARRFTPISPVYVSPDFTVEWRDDKLTFIFNDGSLPQLRLSRRYREVTVKPQIFPKRRS